MSKSQRYTALIRMMMQKMQQRSVPIMRQQQHLTSSKDQQSMSYLFVQRWANSMSTMKITGSSTILTTLTSQPTRNCNTRLLILTKDCGTRWIKLHTRQLSKCLRSPLRHRPLKDSSIGAATMEAKQDTGVESIQQRKKSGYQVLCTRRALRSWGLKMKVGQLTSTIVPTESRTCI